MNTETSTKPAPSAVDGAVWLIARPHITDNMSSANASCTTCSHACRSWTIIGSVYACLSTHAASTRTLARAPCWAKAHSVRYASLFVAYRRQDGLSGLSIDHCRELCLPVVRRTFARIWGRAGGGTAHSAAPSALLQLTLLRAFPCGRNLVLRSALLRGLRHYRPRRCLCVLRPRSLPFRAVVRRRRARRS